MSTTKYCHWSEIQKYKNVRKKHQNKEGNSIKFLWKDSSELGTLNFNYCFIIVLGVIEKKKEQQPWSFNWVVKTNKVRARLISSFVVWLQLVMFLVTCLVNKLSTGSALSNFSGIKRNKIKKK